jgi:hypothetical protein
MGMTGPATVGTVSYDQESKVVNMKKQECAECSGMGYVPTELKGITSEKSGGAPYFEITLTPCGNNCPTPDRDSIVRVKWGNDPLH